MVHLSSVNNFYVIFQVLSHCSFVILLTLHSLFLHYFCLIFFTVERVFSIWPSFSFPRCLLLPLSDTAHSETSEHKFMSISGTELTVHCQSPIQIQSMLSVEQNYKFSLPIRDTNGGFPFGAAKNCSYSFLSYSTASYILTSQDV